MTPKSYSQHGEDVRALFALSIVSGNGFYVDVGAGDPTQDSVTYAMYRMGWRGICIEPQLGLHARAVIERPRDHNLCVAASSYNGVTDLVMYPDHWGWATTNPVQAQRHENRGVVGVPTKVPCVRLTQVLDAYRPPHIDLMNIDVEGSERRVLLGLDLRRYQPTIIVIEAREAGSMQNTAHKFDDLLFPHGYRCVLDDGLNRWYTQHVRIGSRLQRGPAQVGMDTMPGGAGRSG